MTSGKTRYLMGGLGGIAPQKLKHFWYSNVKIWPLLNPVLLKKNKVLSSKKKKWGGKYKQSTTHERKDDQWKWWLIL